MKKYKLPKIKIGYRVGHLTVAAQTNERKSGYTVWECHCDCSGMIMLDTRCLQRGTITDCGCISKLKPGQKDISGERFGKLTAICATEERDRNGSLVWLCRCDCGNEILVPLGQLTNGYRKSCNCLSKPPVKDWVGKRFGKLEVIRHAGKRNGSHMWECRCDCGNVVTVSQSNLKIAHTTSCGCNVDIKKNVHFVEGTCVELIQSDKLFSTNSSGVRGVYKNKKTGKWIAMITFKRKRYYLGSYESLDEAEKARKSAEDKMFGDFLSWYRSQRAAREDASTLTTNN